LRCRPGPQKEWLNSSEELRGKDAVGDTVRGSGDKQRESSWRVR
jgi:hypothetical protein